MQKIHVGISYTAVFAEPDLNTNTKVQIKERIIRKRTLNRLSWVIKDDDQETEDAMIIKVMIA